MKPLSPCGCACVCGAWASEQVGAGEGGEGGGRRDRGVLAAGRACVLQKAGRSRSVAESRCCSRVLLRLRAAGPSPPTHTPTAQPPHDGPHQVGCLERAGLRVQLHHAGGRGAGHLSVLVACAQRPLRSGGGVGRCGASGVPGTGRCLGQSRGSWHVHAAGAHPPSFPPPAGPAAGVVVARGRTRMRAFGSTTAADLRARPSAENRPLPSRYSRATRMNMRE